MKKPFLFTPGPTPVPQPVLQALSNPAIYHRSSSFRDRFKLATDLLRPFFATKQDVLILTSSGTGALEASISNLHSPNDQILVVDAGKFGERFHKIAKAYGLNVDILKVEWGQAVSVLDLAEKLKHKKYSTLCIQACETSTGTRHPIEEISKLLQKMHPDLLLIVDGITSVGAEKILMDEWKIDVLISGSQKAFMIPPGLSFIALSERAQGRLTESTCPRFYFDLKRELDAQKNHQSAFTPATALIEGLIAALHMMHAEGLDKIFERHQKMAAASRIALEKLNLKMASSSPAVACTAAYLPGGIDGKAFLTSIREQYGFLIAGGQDQWEGKILRLSHLGYYSGFDLMNAISAIALELNRRKHICSLGSAIEAFSNHFFHE